MISAVMLAADGSRRWHYTPVPQYMRKDWCDECGARHSKERRLRVLRANLPCTTRDLFEGWGHLWPVKQQWKGDHYAWESRLIYRDLREIGAVNNGGVWSIQKAVAA